MTISRGQMERQLRMGGGIMDIVPREPAILGGIKKAVKKVGKTVGKIAKSDIGKAALGAAALYYAPKIGIKAAGGLKPFLVGAPTNLATGKAAFSGILGTGGQFAPSVGKIATALGIGGGGKAMGSLGKLATLGAVSTFLTKQFGMSPEQAEETLANPESRALYLRRYYKNLNPNAGDEEVEEFVAANVAEYMAEGGRIGYASGTGYNASKRYSILIDKYNKGIPLTPAELDELEMLEMTYADKSETLDMAEGGRIGFAEGESGIMKMASELGDESDALAIQLFGKPVKELNPAEMQELQDEIDRLINKFRAEGPVLPPDTTQPVNPFGPKPGDFGIEEDIPIKTASYGYNEAMSDTFDMFLDMKKKGLIPPTMEFDEFLQEVVPEMGSKRIEETRGLAALGGRIGFDKGTTERGVQGLAEMGMGGQEGAVIVGPDGKLIVVTKEELEEMLGGNMSLDKKGIELIERKEKAKGDTASDNAMQAAGIEGLPIRQNPKGVRELDLRETGGFIPPVGIKEKEDDIPAMLSNNEFVFTADAVRGMGGGDVNKGAQMLYDQMKMLEAGGKV